MGSAGDGTPVYVDVGDEAIHGVIAAPSRSGKTTLCASLIASMRAHSAGLHVIIIDPKGGAEFPQQIAETSEILDLSDHPEAALKRIQEIEDDMRLRIQIKAKWRLKSMREGWRTGNKEALKFKPILIVADEFGRLVHRRKSKSGTETPYDLACEALKLLLINSLQQYTSLGVFVVLVSQTARASEFASLAGAQDSLSYAVYGRMKPTMAAELGHPELATDREVGHLKGAFFLEYRGRLVKFRTNLIT